MLGFLAVTVIPSKQHNCALLGCLQAFGILQRGSWQGAGCGWQIGSHAGGHAGLHAGGGQTGLQGSGHTGWHAGGHTGLDAGGHTGLHGCSQ